MNTKYDPKKIEPKWQKEWEVKKLFYAKTGSKKKKFYALVEFPYPSGEGLHTGHVRGYTAMDIVARKRRMEGREVLYPIGWDAFGLPTENFAIKTGIHPEKVTKKNTDTFRKQMKSLGFSFDWSREINTTDPEYYKWTQWIFLQLFKKGLAYKAKMNINWCPSCKIGLANEEAVGGVCERCGKETETREKEQWMLAITKYANRLDTDLDSVEYLEKIKVGQRNWIGRSEGTLIKFPISNNQFPNNSQIQNSQDFIEVFTTRVDTIFGCTYVVVAPEHQLIFNDQFSISNSEEVRKYIESTKKKTEQERNDASREKTGVKLEGVEAMNPFTGESVPIFVADYVLGNYGTGAVMAVPAHDERDFAFAKKYDLPVKRVVEPKFVSDTKGDMAIKSDQDFVKRDVVAVVVRNPKEDSYLCISWKTVFMHGLVTGGIEKGESIVNAAQREVLEETGYKNLELVSVSDVALHCLFYHRVKHQNRWARFQYVFFDLKNEERTEVSEHESLLHEVLWKKKEELRDFFSVIEGEFILNLIDNPDYIYTGDGILHASGEFSEMDSEEAREKMTAWLVKKKLGKKQVNYKLRDWVFSRQRYWGEPIPIVKCETCGWVPVPEKDLPLKLPKVKSYVPTDTGESPLAAMEKWVATTCPKCGGSARRETDTMPNWAGSSWYYLAYAMQGISGFQFPISKYKKAFTYWTPVDWYNGGMEHTTLHLLYSRFWHKFLFDIGVAPTKEPYRKRTSHGLILAEGGVKMSKSKGNVVNPDDIVRRFGADTLRVYEMFMGPFDQDVAWSMESIAGSRRFLEKAWKIQFKVKSDHAYRQAGKLKIHTEEKKLISLLHKTIKKVSEDIEGMRFNTAVSALMILANEMEREDSIDVEHYLQFLILLSPFAPHIAEELWSLSGNKQSIILERWPKANPKFLKEETVELVVQVNGKLRARLSLPAGSSQEGVVRLARLDKSVKQYLENAVVRKVIFVPDRLVNFVL